jgi:hypothetical protein
MKLTVKGKKYVLVVLKVTSSDPLGRPEAATFHFDERETFDLKGGEEFITAFVPEDVARPKMKFGKR